MTEQELLQDLDTATKSGDVELSRAIDAKLTEMRHSQMTHTTSSSSQRLRQPSSFADLWPGFKQGLYEVGMGALQRAMEESGNPRAGFLTQQVERDRQRAAQEAEAKGPKSLAYEAGRVGGTALPVTAAGVAMGPSLPAAVIGGGLGGFVMPSTSPEETMVNTGVGALMAGGTALGGRMIAPRAQIEPEQYRSMVAAHKRGIPLSGGQMSGEPIVQRAEARAMWNPFTRWHAVPFDRKQSDEFVREMLADSGVPRNTIPKNPSLNPKTLDSAFKSVGKRLDEPFSGKNFNLFTKRTNDAISAARNAAAELPEEDARIVAAEIRRASNLSDSAGVTGEQLQGKLRRMAETVGRLDAGTGGRGGNKEAADIVQMLHDSLIDQALKGKTLTNYNAAKADYARLMATVETLQKSKSMGAGVPDREKLAKVIESNFPGGVTRNRSTMADLARAGEISRGSGALPDRASGIPQFSDLPNTFTYARWNNPVAKFGMLHPTERDIVEMLTRYLPAQTLMEQ